MHDRVDRSIDGHGQADVMQHERESAVLHQLSDVLFRTGDEVVHTYDFVPPPEQRPAQ